MQIKFYIVGGFVRDKILGIKSKDIDYSVEAPSFQAMTDEIIARGGEIFLSTPEYFTVRAKVPNLGVADYVLCRKEGAYSDGRHPDSVSAGTLHDDLARRDFTVNAIAVDEDGNTIDPFDGVKDIERRIIRCVGSTVERLTEDPLRILRAIRFHITKGMTLHTHIVDLLHNESFCEKITTVSVERIREELMRCFSFSTIDTLKCLSTFPHLQSLIFCDTGLKLKPTLEKM